MSALLRHLWAWHPLGGGVARPLTQLALVVPMLMMGAAAPGGEAEWLLAWWFLTLAAATVRWVRDFELERTLDLHHGRLVAVAHATLDVGVAFVPWLAAVVVVLRVAAFVAFLAWLGADLPGVPVSYHRAMLVTVVLVEWLLALLDEATRIEVVRRHDETGFLESRLRLATGRVRPTVASGTSNSRFDVDATPGSTPMVVGVGPMDEATIVF